MAQSIVNYLIKACWTASETAQLRPWRSGWGGGVVLCGSWECIRWRRRCWFDTAVQVSGGSSLTGGWGHVYDDFSFLALGESAAWEFTPLTPLAKDQSKIKNQNRIISISSIFPGRIFGAFC